MSRQGPIGIRIQGGSDCVIDGCGFVGLGTAVELEGGQRHRVSNSRFQRNRTDISIRDGIAHSIEGNVFEGGSPSKQAGLKAIRERLSLGDKLPDREILASLHAVLREHDQKGKQDAARKSSLGKWLIEHGSDVNVAVNTIVTLAAAVAQWFK
jgi:hypothetical protein